jgi:DnaJ-class molecular chaperone
MEKTVSQFVKPCKKCNGSGETDGPLQKKEVCSMCNGSKHEVDYDYLQYFQRKVWERLPNEKIISLVREIDEGIESVKSLPNYPKDFLSQLYFMRGQYFEFLAASASENKLGYFYEARRSFKISHNLDRDVPEDD